MVEFIGYLAGFIAMITFLPQVMRTIRAKKSDDISLWMLSLTLLANVLYEIYAIALSLTPVIVMIGLMNIIVVLQIYLTIKYRKKNIIEEMVS